MRTPPLLAFARRSRANRNTGAKGEIRFENRSALSEYSWLAYFRMGAAFR
jgi:hypothetical protein